MLYTIKITDPFDQETHKGIFMSEDAAWDFIEKNGEDPRCDYEIVAIIIPETA